METFDIEMCKKEKKIDCPIKFDYFLKIRRLRKIPDIIEKNLSKLNFYNELGYIK